MNENAAKSLGILPFDPADYLLTDQDCAAYLAVVQGENDPASLAAALETIKRVRAVAAPPASS